MQHQSARPRGRRSYTACCATCAGLFDEEDYRAQSPCRPLTPEHRAHTPTITRRRSMRTDRKSTRLNSSHGYTSYAVFCLKKKKRTTACTRSITWSSSSALETLTEIRNVITS